MKVRRWKAKGYLVFNRKSGQKGAIGGSQVHIIAGAEGVPVVVEERVSRVVDELGEDIDGVAYLAQREVGESQDAKIHFVQFHDEVEPVSSRSVQVGKDTLLRVLVLADYEGDLEGGRASCAGYVRRDGHPHLIREEALPRGTGNVESLY